MRATAEERLDEVEVKFADKSACCVVLASNGYPKAYEKGFEIKIGELAENANYYIAGAKLDDNGKLLTNGGRVLNVVATADTLEQAIKDAYKATESITFENAYCRKDIGQKALQALKK